MATKQPIEIFRDVPGFIGYQVSNFGKIRSCRQWGFGAVQDAVCETWRTLKPGISSHGYLQLQLRLEGKSHTRNVHHLVLLAFVGPCPDGMECCHANGNPLDNRLENLRWDARAGNLRDLNRHRSKGIVKPQIKRGRKFQIKLSDKDVEEIRYLHGEGFSYKAIAARYGVHSTYVNLIVRGLARRKPRELPDEIALRIDESLKRRG